MEFEDFDYDKANLLCANFGDKAKEIKADTPTMIFAAMRLFMTLLKFIIIPDPKTGRKFERAMAMVPSMIMSYNIDFPMDEPKED